MKKLLMCSICGIFLFTSSCNKRKNVQVDEQYPLTKRVIDLQFFKKKDLDFSFLDHKPSITNVEYIILDTINEANLNFAEKCIMDDNFIYILSGRNNELFIYDRSGILRAKYTNGSLGLGVLSDFIVNNGILSVLDGKKDIIVHFIIEQGGARLRKEKELQPTFEIDTFWQLNSEDFLATTSSWNNPRVDDQLLKCNEDFNITREGFYRHMGYDDDNYILADNFFHSYDDHLYVTHSTDNVTFLFDNSGNLSEVIEIKHGDNSPKEFLRSLEKNAHELSNFYFINHFIHIKNNIITGKIALGLSPKVSFVADTSSKTLYLQKRPFTSVFSNTIGSHEDKIISILLPGQSLFVKETKSISDNVKRLLEKGKYVICLIKI